MKNLIKLLLVCFVSVAYTGNQDIYLTQSGGGAFTLTIDQIGSTNKVGTSGARVTMAGSSITADLKQGVKLLVASITGILMGTPTI